MFRDFTEVLTGAGLEYKCGYWEFENDKLEDIIIRNSKLLMENFELGYEEHYSHGYKQSYWRFRDFSEVRLYILNESENDHFDIKDGSYVYANGYHAEDDMVEIIYKGKRYSVADLEFAKYLRNVCRYGDPSDLEFLRDKYPEYFDLRTAKGLEVYVWQMSPGSYSCGVMEGTNREKTHEELMGLKGASIHEMKAILSSYDIPKEDMIIIPWQDPVSSYMPEYLIGQKDEDPAAAEKRKQEYIDGIRKMLFE